MFAYLYEWMENLAGYLILVTAVLQILPKSSYEKYVRFFTGLLLCAMLAAPLLHLFGMGDRFQRAYEQSVRQQEREMERQTLKYMEGMQNALEPETDR